MRGGAPRVAMRLKIAVRALLKSEERARGEEKGVAANRLRWSRQKGFGNSETLKFVNLFTRAAGGANWELMTPFKWQMALCKSKM